MDYSQMDDETEAGEFYLDSLAIYPEYRRRGIARQLLKRATEHAASLNLPAALLVDKGNPNAERLYRSVGFEYCNGRTRDAPPALSYRLKHKRLELKCSEHDYLEHKQAQQTTTQHNQYRVGLAVACQEERYGKERNADTETYRLVFRRAEVVFGQDAAAIKPTMAGRRPANTLFTAFESRWVMRYLDMSIMMMNGNQMMESDASTEPIIAIHSG